MKKYFFSFFTLSFILGIIVANTTNPSTKLQLYFILIIFCLFLTAFIKHFYVRSLSVFLQVILLGSLLFWGYNKQEDLLKESANICKIVVVDNFKNSNNYSNYKIKNITTKSYGLLRLPKNIEQLYPKDTIIAYADIKLLQEAKNPYQFNYSDFLRKKKINHTITNPRILKISNSQENWKKSLIKSKEELQYKLKEFGYNKETRAIISAMLLGDKTELPEKLNQEYIYAGVVHLLAISGLHVLMIFVVIQFLLNPLNYFKNGKNIKIIVSLLAIWFFAIYVNLTPSVFRASLMLTIYYIFILLKRPTNIYHTLSLSAFILLVINPNNLFDVGFQLSYAAVFFIVWLQPIYKVIYKPKTKIVNYFYDLSTTSISAQIGTMPFTILYFKQFTFLFILGNIVLIPAAFAMLVGAIIAVFLSLLDIKLSLYVTLYNVFIDACNYYISWLASYETFIIKNIKFSIISACLVLVIIIAIRFVVISKSKKAILLIFVCLIGLESIKILDTKRIKNSSEMIIFNVPKSTLIGVREGKDFYVITDKQTFIDNKKYILDPYITENRINKLQYLPIDSVYFDNKVLKTESLIKFKNSILFIGESYISNDKIDYALVRNSNKKLHNINNLKGIIADGSNYPSYINKLDSLVKNQSKDMMLWNTQKDGFYSIKF